MSFKVDTMPHSMVLFDTRDQARDWLIARWYRPCHADDACAMGVWRGIDAQYVQAFKSMAGGWTVKKYDFPNPDNYINE